MPNINNIKVKSIPGHLSDGNVGFDRAGGIPSIVGVARSTKLLLRTEEWVNGGCGGCGGSLRRCSSS